MRSIETNPRGWPLVGLLVALTTGLVGCETALSDLDPTADPDAASQVENIDDPTGGFNTADETAGFGEPYLTSQDEGEQPIADETENEAEVEEMMARDEVSRYAVRILWGYLARDSSNADARVDWTGHASVESGAIIGKRTILFEPLQGDHVVRPRESRERIDWVSTTTVAFDGLQLLVLDPSGSDVANALTVEMPLLSVSIPTAQLDGLDRTISVDDAGHEVRILARKLGRDDPAHCRHGWLAGLWIVRADGEAPGDRPDSTATERGGDGPGVRGRFLGHWSTADGTVVGTVRGFFGVNRLGHRVLFGKMITRNGRFDAFVRGTYERSDRSDGHGRFVARILNAEHDSIGGMRGAWETRRGGHGFFHGGWALLCADRPESDVDGEVDDSVFDSPRD